MTTVAQGSPPLTLTFLDDGQDLDWIELVPFVMPTPMP
ncbi:hypothetical protein Mpal_1341 [Methanosphaerula palustris E1-9c]|uniref:Uncharacterized protein n=1 Tax=Methanosphaerula palustris (strain ATCC BAA-1556 / DSM 19958 / E1-9c) TaxID=521011 RepID=B8GHR9_METPE|nr:hypothetical protein Mpal_1341 [Methanosphaerula palustris E1-9c]